MVLLLNFSRLKYLHPSHVNIPESLFLIAGSGIYPRLIIEAARTAGVKKITVAAFQDETPESTTSAADEVHWMRVGQLGRLLAAGKKSGAHHALMAGQLAPKNLFALRPDLKTLVVLARLKRRNAATMFAEVANQLENIGVTLLDATTFLDDHMAPEGAIAGPRLKARQLEDIRFGFEIVKETSRLDIGQTVVVKNGTVLAVEAFEGTNDCLRRGGGLGQKDSIMVKVTKPGQDMRFDVPVIGDRTIEVAREAKITIIAVEAHRTVLLDKPVVCQAAEAAGISLYGISS